MLCYVSSMSEGTTKQTKEYLTVEQVADVLLVHWQTVLDYIRTGQLPAVKLNKGYRVARVELDNFLRQKTTGKTTSDVIKVKERISGILSMPEFKDVRTLTLSASLFPDILVEDLFSGDRDNSYAELLRNPPTTRSMGWGFKTSSNDPKPVLGQCLELKIGRGVVVRIFKDGNVIATGSASKDFLGWAVNNMEDYDNPGDNINALAAAEFMYNFAQLLVAFIGKLKSKPSAVTFHINISNPNRSKMMNQLKPMGWPITEAYGEPTQEKEIFVEQEFRLMAEPDIDELAAHLWKEYSHIFGLLDDRVEYLDDSRTKFNRQAFSV